MSPSEDNVLFKTCNYKLVQGKEGVYIHALLMSKTVGMIRIASREEADSVIDALERASWPESGDKAGQQAK